MNKCPLWLKVGIRFGKSRRRGGFLSFITASSIIGIAIGVAALTIGLSAMNGFAKELESRLLSVIPHGQFTGANGRLGDHEAVAKELLAMPGIAAASPFVNVNALIDKGGAFSPVRLKGIDPKSELGVVPIDKFVTAGALDKLLPGSRAVILGDSVAQKSGLKIGDSFEAIVAESSSFYDRIAAPKSVTLNVVGIFKLSGQLDGLIGFMNIEDAASVAGLPYAAVEGIEVRTDDYLAANSIVSFALRSLDRPLYAESWMRMHGNLYRDIQLVRSVIYIAIFTVICVACFNIVSGLMMALNEKRQSVAILMSMGARRSLIRKAFVTIGMVNGLLGVFLGLVAGTLISFNLGAIFKAVETLLGISILNKDLYFIDFIPSSPQLGDFVLAGVGAIVMSLLATLYPAFRAGKVPPAIELSKGR